MTDFPAIVYKTPGPHGKLGKTYAYLGVADQEALDAALDAGWYASKAEAFDGNAAAKIVADVKEAHEALDEAIDEVSPATRDEMEQRAKELGMRNVHRMKDETLAAHLAEAG